MPHLFGGAINFKDRNVTDIRELSIRGVGIFWVTERGFLSRGLIAPVPKRNTEVRSRKLNMYMIIPNLKANRLPILREKYHDSLNKSVGVGFNQGEMH